ncbi:3-methyl-2-oxobutanoate hydroxymethyltransferase [Parelusimicrobium proximum]|uniref:3-methyl-2-oxobutanoate hydroxymethyltransferase n=1 Tax=Parelusimicrobium proximum TaxID=3228953 RepID=UPI003D172D96
MTKLTTIKMKKMKADKEPISWVTAYDYPFAYAAEQAGIEMILVGDSGGMVQLGYPTTNPVTMEEMLTMAKAARRGAPNTFIVGDMPQGSYEIDNASAVSNALRFIKEAGADAIKLEGGRRVAERVKAISDAGILVVGHLGLTPQSSSSFGGYRVQGKTLDSFEETVLDAIALEEAGACALLLEAMPAVSAEQIAKRLSIPVLGIGAGGLVDGQLIIMHDILGFYEPFRPWFAKSYIPEVVSEFNAYLGSIGDLRKAGREERKDGMLKLAQMALEKYVKEVKDKTFPGEDYSYPIKPEELADIKKSEYWIK